MNVIASRFRSERGGGTKDLICPHCSNGILLPDTMTLSLWDFGGQEVFYPTHSLFLVRFISINSLLL